MSKLFSTLLVLILAAGTQVAAVEKKLNFNPNINKKEPYVQKLPLAWTTPKGKGDKVPAVSFATRTRTDSDDFDWKSKKKAASK